MTTPEEPTDRDALAAELALGLVEGEELAAARRQQLADPAFAREVQTWQRRFEGLFASVPPAEVPDRVEPRVMAAIADRKEGVSPIWRWVAAGSSLAAACLAAALLLTPERVRVVMAPAPPPPLFAAIAPTDAKPFGVVYDPARAQVRLAETVAAPQDRTAELWVIGADGVPHALGLLRRQGGTALVIVPQDRQRIDAGATLAISIEPVGGSPTGLPTGPVVATGALTRI